MPDGEAGLREEALRLPVDDGSTLPATLFLPEGRPRGGVILYMDIFGMRPELDQMCRRYAEAGYATFLPDLFHRLGTLRFPPPAHEDDPLDPAAIAANDATTLDRARADTGAIVAFVVSRPNLGIARLGTVGHCMGARHALAALEAFPERITAAACLHGGRMVWDGPDSPHLLIPRIAGEAYFAFAADDPTCPDAHQALIERTIAAADVHATTEHFDAMHGWTFPERWCFDATATERVRQRVMDLFARRVAPD